MNTLRFTELLLIGSLVLSSGCKKASLVAEASHESSQTIQLVDIATDATDPYDSSDTEPSIAVNPTNPNEISVVAFSGAWGDGGRETEVSTGVTCRRYLHQHPVGRARGIRRLRTIRLATW